MTKTTTAASTATAEKISSQIAYLARALKMPTIGRTWEDIAAQARDLGWSHEEYLAAVLQRQITDRESAGSMMRIRTAHFPAIKTLEDFNYDHLPSLRRDLLAHLATSTYIAKADNVILLGPPGIGKTHLADRARHQGRPSRLLGAVRHRQQLDQPPRRRAQRRTARGRAEEDPPLQTHHHRRGRLHPLRPDAANLFFQLVASRYEQGSIMVTSNLPFGRWGETFCDDVVAAAMIDRLVHHAEVLTLAGDSYRTRARRELLAKDRDK